MKLIKVAFIVIFCLVIYKLTFLSEDTCTTDNKFRIYRDSEGIPHIYSKNYEDIFFALGYAQAQDRMWSFYFKKMFIQGRLSEMFGSATVPLDIQSRNIGYLNVGKQNANLLDNKTRKYMQSYVDGINQYAKNTKILPFQFYLLWLNWQDWQIQHVLANAALVALSIDFNWYYEIARQRLLETVGFDLAYKIISIGSGQLFKQNAIINDEELKQMKKFKQYDLKEQKNIIKKHWADKNMTIGTITPPKLQTTFEGTGSNSWIIGGQHTFHGKPILSSDPHLVSLIPSMFYTFQMVLLDEDNKIKSRKFGSMPNGFPTMTIGVSEIATWGATAAYRDNKDVYYETVRKENGKYQYLYKEEWKNFIERYQTIKVRGAEPVEEVFYHTHRGVVLEQIFMDVHWKYGYPFPQKFRNNHTLTIDLNIFRPDNSSAKGLVSLMTFETQEQFVKAGELINYPNVDSSFVFKNNVYGFASVGGIAKRQIPEMGAFIKDGTTDLYDIKGYQPKEKSPEMRNPKKGYIALSNHRFASPNHIDRTSLNEITTGRIYRSQKIITDKISKGEKFTFDDMKLMQLDQRDEFVADIIPKLLKKLTSIRKIWSHPLTQKYFDLLLHWDFIMDKESVQSSIYHALEYNFISSLFLKTSLSQEQRQAIINHGYFETYLFVLYDKIANNTLTQQEQIICKTNETNKYAQYHPCEAALGIAFANLPIQLKKLFGTDDFTTYHWGDIHQQVFKSIPFGEIPLLKNIWGRKFRNGGNSRTLNVAIHTHQNGNYHSLVDANFRMISDINTTYYNLNLGQSDRVLSPFYDNFLDKNTQFYEYKPNNPFKEDQPLNWQVSITNNL